MSLPFELQIALRYLLARRKQALISLISFISIVGVAVGVMAVIIALAVMTGLQQEVRDRILGANAHVYVWKKGGVADYRAEVEKLLQVPHVVGAAPALMGEALLSLRGASHAVHIKGIDPELEQQVADVRGAMRSGSLGALESAAAGDLGAVLIGSEVAARLGAGVGDIVSVITPAGLGTPGGVMPIPRRLRVGGVFHIGIYEIDAAFAYVTLGTAKRLLRVDDIDLIQLRADHLDNARTIKETIQARSGVDFVEDWTDMNQQLYQALWLEKIAISLAVGLIIMVASLNIVGTLILLVMEKHRDIAILKTMGTTARSVMWIFVLQGLIIGVTGTAVGGALGLGISTMLDRYKLIRVPEDVYQVSYLPFTVLPLEFILVLGGALAICLLATIYPSHQAARLDPVQALRYE